MPNLTPFGKLVVAAIAAMLFMLGAHFILQQKKTQVSTPSVTTDKTSISSIFSGKSSNSDINVCVVTWGGYAGGQYMNRGFNPNPDSQFTKYGLNVTFTTIDDFSKSRKAWQSGECDLLWTTVDSYTTEAENLKNAGFDPVLLFQADWSRGGDAIIANSNVKTIADLKGKKVAVTLGTPSHTFLLRMLNSAGMTATDVTIIETAGAPDAAKMFQTGQVDAAVVWSPDDEASIKIVPGSKALITTKVATHIIADGFIVKRDYLNENRENLQNLVRLWLKGNAEINSSGSAKAHAASILATGYNIPADEAAAAINRVRLVTIGDNRQFFGVDLGANVTGNQLFTQSASLYQSFGYNDLVPSIPSWRDYSDASIVSSLSVDGVNDEAEGKVKVIAKAATETIATKNLSVSFKTGSAELSDDGKVIITRGFLNDATASQGAAILIEGNTDNVGNQASNVVLSKKRAAAVADYLVKLGINPDRMKIVGNGPDRPVCYEDTSECRAKNRRTDFSLQK